MNIRFDDAALFRMITEPTFDGGFTRPLADAYRIRIQFIQDADDERAFYRWKGLHFERLKGKRRHQHSMRLNKQFRLIIEIEPAKPGNLIAVKSIEDYRGRKNR